MPDRTIRLCYRKIIDASSTKVWDKLVFDSSYLEFRMQAQTVTNGSADTSYSAILQKFPVAQQLAGRVAPAITGYVQQLGNLMPDLLNNIGKRFLKFDSYAFEIINSDVNDKAKHHIAINFFSENLIWHDTIGNYLLLSAAETDVGTPEKVLTNLFQMQPYVNIHSINQQ